MHINKTFCFLMGWLLISKITHPVFAASGAIQNGCSLVSEFEQRAIFYKTLDIQRRNFESLRSRYLTVEFKGNEGKLDGVKVSDFNGNQVAALNILSLDLNYSSGVNFEIVSISHESAYAEGYVSLMLKELRQRPEAKMVRIQVSEVDGDRAKTLPEQLDLTHYFKWAGYRYRSVMKSSSGYGHEAQIKTFLIFER